MRHNKIRPVCSHRRGADRSEYYGYFGLGGNENPWRLQTNCGRCNIRHPGLVSSFTRFNVYTAGMTGVVWFQLINQRKKKQDALLGSSFQENRANRRPLFLKIVRAYIAMGCFFVRLTGTIDFMINPDAKGTPETLKEIKRRFV